MTDLASTFGDLFQLILKESGQPVYLVGGAVRDAMLGRSAKDLDFVMQGHAGRVGRKVANTLHGGFYMLDEARDTARVIYKPENGKRLFLDFAAYRSADLEGDLRDRDFTINAMAVDLAAPDRLIDPTGGAADLRAKVLRACAPYSFEHDPARTLRAMRQSLALGFRILPETSAALRASVGGLARVSPERIRDELFHMLDGRQVDTAVRLMDRFGILPYVLPELESLKGVGQSAPHTMDVWEHTLHVAGQLEALFNLLVEDYNPDKAANLTLSTAVMYLGRFRAQFRQHFEALVNPQRSLRALLFLAALYHDIAKPAVRSEEPGGRTHFYRHEDRGAQVVEQRARALALSVGEINRLGDIVQHHMRIHHLSDANDAPSRRAIYRFFRATGDAGVEIILLSLADVLATYGLTLPQERWESELEVSRRLLEAYWDTPAEVVKPVRLLTGEDLQREFKLHPGPLIGNLLESLQEAQAMGEVTNRAEAINFIENEINRTNAGKD